MSEIRTVARRDSATTILRKLGVNSRDYGLFIKAHDNVFDVDVGLAKQHVAKVEAQTATPPWEDTPKPKKAKTEKPKAAKPKADKSTTTAVRDGVTVSDTIRRLIEGGKTNKEIWDVVQAEFNLDDKKRHYPAWYRAQMRRAGALPKAD